MYIENYKSFDKVLLNAWENEMKPYIFQKFPITKDGLFTVNSDLEFVINIIDSLKEEYKNNTTISENNKNNDKEKDINNKNTKDIKKEDEDDDEEEDEVHHHSICFYSFQKLNANKSKSENTQINKKETKDKDNKKDEKLNNDEAKKIKELIKEQNISNINKYLIEFIDENIVPPRRTNSMLDIRPHSETIKRKKTCKKTCEISTIEDNLNLNINLNINDLISHYDDLNNHTIIGINTKDLESNKNKKSDNKKKKVEKNKKNEEKKSNNNNNIEKKEKEKDLFENIFKKGEETNFEKNKKIKTHFRSKSLNLLKEMTPVFKDDIEEEGNSIAYKMPDKKLICIYPDILLKKIIFEDFINNNILLINHFCQQCFSFVNREIFFRKIFHCYKFYKNKNTSRENLQNLIEFINILVISMFEYSQKINLKDIFVGHIKNFYMELIEDLVSSFDFDEEGDENNKSDTDENNDLSSFRFESIDFGVLNDNRNKNIKINYNFKMNKKDLINMNLNIELKDINIFIYKEKENKKNKNKYEELFPDVNAVSKSLTFRAPSSPNPKTFFLSKSDFKKNYKEEKNGKSKNNKSSKLVTFNGEKITLPFIIEENEYENEKEKKEEKEEKEENKNCEKKGESNELEEKKEQNEEKQKLFQITKTLKLSQITPTKKALKNINGEEEQKEKSDDEENKKKNKLLYSDKSNSDNSSASSKSENQSDNENDNKIFNFKERNRKNISEKKEKENKEKLELINNILKTKNIPEKLLSLNEKILEPLQYILILFGKEINGEPSYKDLKEAKDHINFYKRLKIIKNEQKKIFILPRKRQKRLTKNYSSIFSYSSKTKINVRQYLYKGYFCIIDWKTEEIGDQLMLISKSLLNKIHPREFYKAIFLKKDKEKTSPNVVKCITNFNRLTSFIIEDILSYDYPKERAKVYEKWVLIAQYCKDNKDYNDLIAIFSALNNYIITGLRMTLKEVRGRINSTFKQICNFCSVEGNYKYIREDMDNCEKTGEVFIPYLGMLMRDINFFEESSKYINEHGCFNFEKIEKIYNLIMKYFRFKKIPQKKSKIEELMFFEDLEDITEEQLEEIANKLEPEFKMADIQKPGKRLNNIDIKYFEKYKIKSSLSANIRDNYGRNTISGL